jgi:hypothetical protein
MVTYDPFLQQDRFFKVTGGDIMRQIRNIQGWLVILAFIATVAVLFGGQTLTAKLKVENPLKQRLAKIREIRGYTVEETANGLKLHLKLDKCRNLQTVLNSAIHEVEFYYKKSVKSVSIKDCPDFQLEQTKYQLSFYLEEAVASGHYIQLKSALDSFNRKGIKARVFLDNDFIYLQLETGKNYLYQALPRPDRVLAMANEIPKGGLVE